MVPPPSTSSHPEAWRPPDVARRLAASGSAGVSIASERHAVEFTGAGSEYFRIWIVNLLLILLTLGLYYPWAKVRRLRYFHTNTLVAGHALDFHGEPRRMLRGLLLVGALLLINNLAGRLSPLAGALAFAVLALVWPALWRASLQFRLANTSWRGLRFRFDGSLRGAYAVFALPLLALLVLAGGVGALVALLAPRLAGQPALALLPLALLLLAYLGVPQAWLLLKRYQHGHYGYGGQQAELRVTAGAAYGVFLRAFGVALATVIAALLLIGGVALLFGLRGGGLAAAAGLVPLIVAVMLLAQAVPRAYLVARLQNLLWSRTGNAHLRFRSALGFGTLLRLMLKNWLLTLLTLGLYWPWAAVAMARLRLQAVSLHARVALDELSAANRPDGGDAAGDAAADLFGIDLGL